MSKLVRGAPSDNEARRERLFSESRIPQEPECDKAILSDSSTTTGTRRFPIYLAIVITILITMMMVSVAIGSVPLPLRSVVLAITEGVTPWQPPPADAAIAPTFTIVWLSRMPRTAMAALVGAALGVAGAQMQGLFQNPLASPDIIGVSAGGALGGVIALATGLATRSLFYLPILSFAGALLALLIVYAIATRRARTAATTLLLGGVALNALIGAITSFLITVTWVRYEVSQQIIFWLMSGLANRTWAHAWMDVPGIGAGLVLAFSYARDLDILAAGEEVASSLRVEVERAKRTFLINAALLTGTAVALSGAIGFVGFCSPSAR